jgi:hypothetical protein
MLCAGGGKAAELAVRMFTTTPVVIGGLENEVDIHYESVDHSWKWLEIKYDKAPLRKDQKWITDIVVRVTYNTKFVQFTCQRINL